MLALLSGLKLAYDEDSRQLVIVKGDPGGDHTVIGPVQQQVEIADAAGNKVGISGERLHVETDDQAADEVIWAQLTAAATSTPWHRVRAGVKNHVFQVKLLLVDTNVVVKCEGSNDGENAFNLNAAGASTTWTANDTYLFTKKNCPCKFVRFTWSTEAGGTAATIDPRWSGTE